MDSPCRTLEEGDAGAEEWNSRESYTESKGSSKQNEKLRVY